MFVGQNSTVDPAFPSPETEAAINNNHQGIMILHASLQVSSYYYIFLACDHQPDPLGCYITSARLEGIQRAQPVGANAKLCSSFP
jgi:hypothetical protein